jgi:hypothetical protein
MVMIPLTFNLRWARFRTQHTKQIHCLPLSTARRILCEYIADNPIPESRRRDIRKTRKTIVSTAIRLRQCAM